MDFQDALNRAVLGIVEQGQLAFDPSGGCSYRVKSNGHRCAIGQLLTNDQLASIEKLSLNHAPILTLVNYNIIDVSFRHAFFDDLQLVHDGAINLDNFLEKAKALADCYGLTFPEIGPASASVGVAEDEGGAP